MCHVNCLSREAATQHSLKAIVSRSFAAWSFGRFSPQKGPISCQGQGVGSPQSG
jgi:hypothetical protein